VIVDIADGSQAQNFGFQRGDRIVSVNNERIARTRELERIAGQQNRLWRITIERGGKQVSVVFGG
jgi:C-terminal processing protease CtpA/Prc